MLDRTLLRDQVRSEVIRRILRGDIPPGSRINEVSMSKELGVSRTPLRDALMGLAGEGFLEAEAARGFSVLPLTKAEVENTYPILWSLESLALRLIDHPKEETIKGLKDINDALASDVHDYRRVELDTEWHALLIADCNNGRLLEMIDGLKRILRRYEMAYLRDSGLVHQSLGHHRELLSAYESGEMSSAAEMLVDHWRHGMNALLEWLDETEVGSGGDGIQRLTRAVRCELHDFVAAESARERG